jgi:hypothetical protein
MCGALSLVDCLGAVAGVVTTPAKASGDEMAMAIAVVMSCFFMSCSFEKMNQKINRL